MTGMGVHGLLLVLLLADLGASAPPAMAPAPQALAGEPARAWKLRLTMPWLSGRYFFLGPRSEQVYPEHYRHWAPSILEGSLSCELLHRLVVEAGGGLANNLRRVVYLRGGPMLSLAHGPTASFSLQGLLGLGYRSQGYDARASDSVGRKALLADAGLAVDATRWWPSGWGLSLRARGTVGRALATSGPIVWEDREDPGVFFQDDADWSLELALDLGLAWR